jgi:hypothetical protein
MAGGDERARLGGDDADLDDVVLGERRMSERAKA